MTNILWEMIILLACAVVFGLICTVLALTWWCVKFIGACAKEAWKECSVVKDAPTENSDVTLHVKNTNESEPKTNE
jgi:hypothetical protein